MRRDNVFVFLINTLAIFASPTRDSLGHIENARNREGQIWVGQQGNGDSQTS